MLKRTILASLMAVALLAAIGCQPESKGGSQSSTTATESVPASGSDMTQNLASGSATSTDSAAATDSSAASDSTDAAPATDSN
ncbi:MAG: hypothetical protein KGR26_01630 [Cyanobacteria bacterium REEB65]|nr:hypothetical protein [Cyanobacteria bacterium REEB65]